MPERVPPEGRAADGALTGRRIVLTAQRKADELAGALERHGAQVVHAATMSHVPLPDDDVLARRTRALIAAPPDLLVVTTGIGFRGWLEAAEGIGRREELMAALGSAIIYARGPKARGAVSGAGLDVAWTAQSETAAEVKQRLASQSVAGLRVAVQHHGAGSDGIDESLRRAGADVESVVVYRWGGAPDPAAVENALRAVASRDVDGVIFTAAPGVEAFFAEADRLGLTHGVLSVLRSGAVRTAAVGDTTAAPLRSRGVEPAVPERFRLGALARLVVSAWAI